MRGLQSRLADPVCAPKLREWTTPSWLTMKVMMPLSPYSAGHAITLDHSPDMDALSYVEIFPPA